VQHSSDPAYLAHVQEVLPAKLQEVLDRFDADYERIDEQDVIRWARLFAAGCITHRRQWNPETEKHEDVPCASTWQEELAWFVPRYLAERDSELWEERFRITGWICNFEKAGWTWRRFPESAEGITDMKAAVLDLGFTLDADEEAQWADYSARYDEDE